ncbi:MAG: YdbH domain-containing protein [Magnetococcales bacterium]|nr:YdbH domain-containing protein [Magnetococcales bacterium]
MDGVDYTLPFQLFLARTDLDQPRDELPDGQPAMRESVMSGDLTLSLLSQGDKTAPVQPFAVQLGIQVADFFRAPRFELSARGQAVLSHGVIQALTPTLPALKGGSGELELRLLASGMLPPWQDEEARLYQEGRGKGELLWSIQDLHLPSQRLDRLQSQGGSRLVWQDGKLGIGLVHPLTATLAEQPLMQLLPAALQVNFVHPVRLAVQPLQTPLFFQWALDPFSWQGSGGLQLSLESGGQARLLVTLNLADLLGGSAPQQPLMGPSSLTVELTDWQWGDVDLPVNHIELRWQRQTEHFQLLRAACTLLDAAVTVDPSHWQWSPPAGQTVIRLSDLALEKLTRLVAVQGVDITGQLSGEIPVALSADGVSITEGRLSTDQPGTVRLAADLLQQLAGENGLPEIVVKALENYHYQRLSLAVNRDMDGEYLVLLQAMGNNPDLDNGRPVALNLNLSGQLDQIIHRLLVVKGQMDAIDDAMEPVQ